jgi:hypothetical protein
MLPALALAFALDKLWAGAPCSPARLADAKQPPLFAARAAAAAAAAAEHAELGRGRRPRLVRRAPVGLLPRLLLLLLRACRRLRAALLSRLVAPVVWTSAGCTRSPRARSAAARPSLAALGSPALAR